MLMASLRLQWQRHQEAQPEADAAPHLRAPPSQQPWGQFSITSCTDKYHTFIRWVTWLTSHEEYTEMRRHVLVSKYADSPLSQTSQCLHVIVVLFCLIATLPGLTAVKKSAMISRPTILPVNRLRNRVQRVKLRLLQEGKRRQCVEVRARACGSKHCCDSLEIQAYKIRVIQNSP